MCHSLISQAPLDKKEKKKRKISFPVLFELLICFVFSLLDAARDGSRPKGGRALTLSPRGWRQTNCISLFSPFAHTQTYYSSPRRILAQVISTDDASCLYYLEGVRRMAKTGQVALGNGTDVERGKWRDVRHLLLSHPRCCRHCPNRAMARWRNCRRSFANGPSVICFHFAKRKKKTKWNDQNALRRVSALEQRWLIRKKVEWLSARV